MERYVEDTFGSFRARRSTDLDPADLGGRSTTPGRTPRPGSQDFPYLLAGIGLGAIHGYVQRTSSSRSAASPICSRFRWVVLLASDYSNAADDPIVQALSQGPAAGHHAVFHDGLHGHQPARVRDPAARHQAPLLAVFAGVVTTGS